MTEKKKIQLSKLTLRVGILFLYLSALFVTAITINPTYLFIVAAGLSVIVIFLLSLQREIDENKSINSLELQNISEKRNLIEAEIEREEKIIKSFNEKIVSYSQLKGLTERLGLCLSLEETSKCISSEVSNLFGDHETTIILYLFHTTTGELGISSSHKGQLRINLKTKNGDEFDQWVVKTMQPLLIEDSKSDYRFDIDRINIDETRHVRSLICVPLMIGHKAIGILRVDSPKQNKFLTEDLRLLTAIGDLGAVAIENAQLYARVEQLAIKDGLTGLYLRGFVLDRLMQETSRHLRRNKDMSLLMIDIDNFKDYNDKFGHVAGDIVLKVIGELLGSTFNQPGNLVCRYGGEEFAVVLTECTKDKAYKLADEFRQCIANQNILLRRKKTKVTVSIGVATFPKDAHNYKELIHHADIALYQAKTQGRNKVCLI